MSTYLKTGWVAPDGTYTHNYMWGHFNSACKILGYETPHADTLLLDAGYVRISNTVADSRMYAITWKNWLTDYQKNFLKDYFEDSTILIDKTSRKRWNEENI